MLTFRGFYGIMSIKYDVVIFDFSTLNFRRFFMKKGVGVKISSIAIALIIVVVGAFIAKSAATVDCSTCLGSGHTYQIACGGCEGAGKIENDEGVLEKCEDCKGTKFIQATSDLSSSEFLNGGSGDPIQADCADCGGKGVVAADSNYYSTFMALFPPLLAIALALITKEVYSSLFIGILLGGLLNTNCNISGSMDVIINDGLIEAVKGTAGIFIFLVILGVMVALINKAGGSAAFGRWAETHIKSRVGAALATFFLGVLIFIDDYFN